MRQTAGRPLRLRNIKLRNIKFRNLKLRNFRMPVLPTLLTLGNGVCGLASATYAVNTVPGGDRSLLIAGLLIFAAMIFDLLDGGAARLMRQTSRFGAELDSLCDAVSFGVAPALILLQLGQDYHPRVLWAIAALFMTCTILRLARFNVETAAADQHDWFSGLPSPAAAATVASFAMIVANEPLLMLPEGVRQFLPSEEGLLRAIRNAVPLVAIVLAGLMVSRVRYPHLVHQMFRNKHQFRQIAQVVFAIAAIVALGAWAAPLILSSFVVASPIRALWQRWNRRSLPLPACLPSTLDLSQPEQPLLAEPIETLSTEAPRPKKLRLWWPAKTGRKRRRA
jgi:CDP-diacylglycerol---serine O-phosphatidyltransferase